MGANAVSQCHSTPFATTGKAVQPYPEFHWLGPIVRRVPVGKVEAIRSCG
jgi:hypothetical protein